ncbi:MAG: restriction endonuclease-like protein, partial [Roseiflexus sp.]|nr:restriction endonuclease-like protein [Roseiflexus sp.]
MRSALEIELSLTVDDDLPAIAEQQPVEFVCLPPGDATLELTIDGVTLMPFLHPGDARWRWAWNPGAGVGGHTLRLTMRVDDALCNERQWRLSVAPRKIDSERYLAILEDVERLAPALVRSLAGADVRARLGRGDETPRSWIDDAAALFGSSFDQFEQAVRRILAHPRSTLQNTDERVPLGQARELSTTALQRAVQGDLEAAPVDAAPYLQRLMRPEGGILPRTVVQESSNDTHNTAEHRLLKRTLELLRGRARRCVDRAQREVTRLAAVASDSSRAARARAIAARCDQCARKIASLLADPFFEQVTALRQTPAVTPLIRRDPAYRQVYRMWRALHQRLVVDPGAPFDLSVVDLPLLYERWCVLQVVQALLNLDIEVHSCSLLAPPADDADAWSFNFQRDEPLLIAARNGWTLRLRYQPQYRPASDGRDDDPCPPERRLRQAQSADDSPLGSLDRHTRIPDIAIELLRPDHLPRVIVLDAKYRLDADGRGIPADALAEAYAYAGAIGVSGMPAVAAALILYPGTGVAERYPGGAGAVPLLPGAAGEL